MQKHQSIAALPHMLSRNDVGLRTLLTRIFHTALWRRQSRKDLRRLLDNPHLARDVGLTSDQIRGALIRLRQEG